VWQGRQRLAQLEKELAQTQAAQAALQQRVDVFEQIAAAAGASLDAGVPLDAGAALGVGASLDEGQRGQPPAGPLVPVPATLLAAATEGRPDGSPVRLAVGGRDVIAVIGDEGGDPRKWWMAIRQLAARGSAP
jgi:hypothetical protein